MTVILGERRFHPAADQLRVDIKERQPDITGKGKFTLIISGIEVIIENPANAPRLIPMLEMEIVISPFLVFRVIRRIMGIAG